MEDFAMTPVITDTGFGIGAAFRDEAGYNPTTYGPYKTWEEARSFCAYFNTKLGLTDEEADTIVISSMRRGSILTNEER